MWISSFISPHAGSAGASGAPDEERGLTAGTLGLLVFLTSLAVFFGGALAAVWLVRWTRGPWPGSGPLPASIWVSTGIIALASAALEGARHAARRGARRLLRDLLLIALALGACFLVSQTSNWVELRTSGRFITSDLYHWLFIVLSGTHALHVVGGLVPLAFVCWRAARRRYTPERHTGVLHAALYWHFLAVVWMGMMVTLLAAR